MSPTVAARSCEICQKFKHDDNDFVGGKISIRAGKPAPRIPGEKPPCDRCPKIPDGAPKFPRYAVELSEKNQRALKFHQRCKITGVWPADAIALRNAVLIEETDEDIRESREERTHRDIQTFIQLSLRLR